MAIFCIAFLGSVALAACEPQAPGATAVQVARDVLAVEVGMANASAFRVGSLALALEAKGAEAARSADARQLAAKLDERVASLGLPREINQQDLRARILPLLPTASTPAERVFLRGVTRLLDASDVRGADLGIDPQPWIDEVPRVATAALRQLLDQQGLPEIAPLLADLGHIGQVAFDLGADLNGVLANSQIARGIPGLDKLIADVADGRNRAAAAESLGAKVLSLCTDAVGAAKGSTGFAEHAQRASAVLHLVDGILGRIAPQVAREVRQFGGMALDIARAIHSFAIGKIGLRALTGNIVGAVLGLVGSLFNSGPSFEEVLLEQIAEIRKDLHQLRREMHERFDRIDAKLDKIHQLLADGFEQVLREQGALAAELRAMNLAVLQQLDRIESKIDEFRQVEAVRGFNRSRAEALTGQPPTPQGFEAARGVFLTLAKVDAAQGPFTVVPGGASAAGLAELPRRSLYESVNLIGSVVQQAPYNNPALVSEVTLPNPLIWAMGAKAYLDLVDRWPGRLTSEQIQEDILEWLIPPGRRLDEGLRRFGRDGADVRRAFFVNLMSSYQDAARSFNEGFDRHIEEFLIAEELLDKKRGLGLALFHKTPPVFGWEGESVGELTVGDPPGKVPLAADSPQPGPAELPFPSDRWKNKDGSDRWDPWAAVPETVVWYRKLSGHPTSIRYTFSVDVEPKDFGRMTRRIRVTYQCLLDSSRVSWRTYQTWAVDVTRTRSPDAYHVLDGHRDGHETTKSLADFLAATFTANWVVGFWEPDLKDPIIIESGTDLETMRKLMPELRRRLDVVRRRFLAATIAVLWDPFAAAVRSQPFALAAQRLAEQRALVEHCVLLAAGAAIHRSARLQAALGTLIGPAEVIADLRACEARMDTAPERRLERTLLLVPGRTRELRKALEEFLSSTPDAGEDRLVKQTLADLDWYLQMAMRGAFSTQ